MRLNKAFRRGRTYTYTPIPDVSLTDFWSDDIERQFFLPRLTPSQTPLFHSREDKATN